MELVDECILEAVEAAATGIDLKKRHVDRDRLRLPAMFKEGGIRKLEDLRWPTFLGALLDTLPKCIDRKDDKEE